MYIYKREISNTNQYLVVKRSFHVSGRRESGRMQEAGLCRETRCIREIVNSTLCFRGIMACIVLCREVQRELLRSQGLRRACIPIILTRHLRPGLRSRTKMFAPRSALKIGASARRQRCSVKSRRCNVGLPSKGPFFAVSFSANSCDYKSFERLAFPLYRVFVPTGAQKGSRHAPRFALKIGASRSNPTLCSVKSRRCDVGHCAF